MDRLPACLKILCDRLRVPSLRVELNNGTASGGRIVNFVEQWVAPCDTVRQWRCCQYPLDGFVAEFTAKAHVTNCDDLAQV